MLQCVQNDKHGACRRTLKGDSSVSQTIRDFLVERGQNPDDYGRLNLDHNVLYSADLYGSHLWHKIVLDIKRFGDLVVVMTRVTDYHSHPGVRRSIEAKVYPDKRKAEYRACDVYIDGGRGTYRLDRPERNFTEIVSGKWEGSDILIEVKNSRVKDTLRCEVERQECVTLRRVGDARILAGVYKLTLDEIDEAAQRLYEKHGARENLRIAHNREHVRGCNQSYWIPGEKRWESGGLE